MGSHEKPKQCPDCGGKGKIWYEADGQKPGGRWVDCGKCGGKGTL
jgi:DnaJ-class molecular chaperone